MRGLLTPTRLPHHRVSPVKHVSPLKRRQALVEHNLRKGIARLLVGAFLVTFALLSLLGHWNLAYPGRLITELDPTFQFPEEDLFFIEAGALLECSQPDFQAAYSLQYALRLCLARPECRSVQWDGRSLTAQLCGSQPSVPPGRHTRRRSLQGNAVYSAVRKSTGSGAEPCPEGQQVVGITRTGRNVCAVCQNQRCRNLPDAHLVPGFGEQVEWESSRLHSGHNMRGINPSVAQLGGQTYVIVRSTNFTLCPPGDGPHVHRDDLQAPFHTKVLLCPANEAMTLGDCTDVPIDFNLIRNPYLEQGYSFAAEYIGLEDARGFEWQGRMHLVGTVTLALKKRKLPRIAMVRLRQDLAGIEGGTVFKCGDIEGPQKNFMPLVIGDDLYLVIQTQPLVVGKVDPVSLACTVHQSATDAHLSLGAVLSSDSFLSGGSTFIPLPLTPNRFLALAHHYTYVKNRVYVHQFVIISVTEPSVGQHRFAVDWVSDAFRLPSDPGKRNGVQFATGLLLKDGSLYISYGITDCYSALAKVEDIGMKLPLWEERGLGTQRFQQ